MSALQKSECPLAGGQIADESTDAPIIAPAEKTGNTDKVFSSLRAEYAFKGHSLHRTDPSDGPVTYWAERWGLVRHLPTIDTVRQFLEAIGGRL